LFNSRGLPMPRSNWKGSISFGLVSIPIILYNSEDSQQKVVFHQIDKRNKARIQYQRVNTKTGKEVPWDNVLKAYEYDKDTIIPVQEDELKKVAGENARTISIEHFVEEEDIHFIDVQKTYYLVPDKKGEKGYVILREALKKSKKVGIAKVIISTKEYLAAVSHYENALVLYLLKYRDEIRPLSEFDIPSDNLKTYKVTSKEIDIANQLIKAMTSKWKPEKYKDEYKVAVHKWAQDKIKHRAIHIMPQRGHAAKTSGKAVDFVDLLKKSLGNNKKIKHPGKGVAHLKKKPAHARRAVLH